MSQALPTNTPAMPVEPARPTWVRWQIVAILVSYSFMTWFNRVSMVAAYDEHIKTESQITPVQVGWVYTAFLLSYTICMTPGGWLIDRFGAWAALVWMGFGSALFGALTSIAAYPGSNAAWPVLAALLVIRPLMGAVTAPVYPASSRIVAQWLPLRHRALANGLVQGAAAVGIASAFPLFGTLMDLVTWPMAFVLSGIVTGILALVWTVFGRNRPRDHRLTNDAERRWIEGGQAPETDLELDIRHAAPLWRQRSLILLTLSYAAVGYVEYLFFHWVHYYFDDILQLGTADSRYYASIVTLAMAAGMVLGGWIADRLRMAYTGRWSRAAVPVGGLCAGAVLIILGLLATETMWIVVWLSLALAAVGAVEAPTWTMAVELGGRQGGTAAAICNTGGNGMGLVAPIVTPMISAWITWQFAVSETDGWKLAISLGSVIAILGAVLWCWISPDDTGRDKS
jgi:MFS transporter, ACS family, D-galactonate transporter